MNVNHPTAFAHRHIVVLWGVGILFIVMNTTMFNIALPRIALALHVSAETAAWLVTAYSITFAIATVIYSRLSDFISIRRLSAIGVIVLGLASIAGSFANNFDLLLIIRVLQASGAAAIPGMAVVMVTRYLPQERHAGGIAIISSSGSLGFGLGPVIGGSLTQFLGWHSLFLITGFVLVLLPLLLRWLPSHGMTPARLDVWGALFLAIGTTGVLLFLSTRNVVTLAVGILSLSAMWWWIHRHPIPFVTPSLLRNFRYLRLTFLGLAAYSIQFATLFVLPLMLYHEFAATAFTTGLLIFPGAFCSALAGRYLGRILTRFGAVRITLIGLCLLLIASSGFAVFGTLHMYPTLILYMMMGVAVSAIMSSTATNTATILGTSEMGAGMGLAQLIQLLGGAVSVTLSSAAISGMSQLPPGNVYSHVFGGMVIVVLLAMTLCLTYVRKRSNDDGRKLA